MEYNAWRSVGMGEFRNVCGSLDTETFDNTPKWDFLISFAVSKPHSQCNRWRVEKGFPRQNFIILVGSKKKEFA